ncbi:ATP-binding protein [Deltaproteobacteria bacterium]|nr:ATP-binding protein [Deltaproteobacteria bacterium]
MKRLIGNHIFDPEITEGKMIFLTGPRQVGKTTFAQDWLNSQGSSGTYFNWDDPSVIMTYKRNPLCFHNIIEEKYTKSPVPLVFDEIHKHMEWRNLLKGLFDSNHDKIKLLVTGSARLEIARKTGDSLLGRYFSYQMFPLGLPEVIGNFSNILNDESPFADGDIFISLARDIKTDTAQEGLELLLKFGGFPEPLLKGSERFHRRWQIDYKSILTKEDVRDLSRISDIKGLETLVEILPSKVGSNLSIPSISEDLGRKYDTIKNWLEILEGLYMVFTIRPWHRHISRAIRKEKKLYFFDWSLLSDSGSRFENLIAVTLLRMAARFNETGLGSYEICYIRDREKREVDFVLVKDNEPIALIEAKESDSRINKSGIYYSRKLNIPIFQVVLNAKKVEVFPYNNYVIPALHFMLLTG